MRHNSFLHVAMAKTLNGTQEDKVQAENAVRAAAKAAARGAPLSEAFLSKIVAETSDSSLSIADRVQRAATHGGAIRRFAESAQYYFCDAAGDRRANCRDEFRFVALRRVCIATVGQCRARHQARAAIRRLAIRTRAGSNPLPATNFAGSSFAGAGLDFGMVSYLRSQDRSFTAQNVLNAANDAKALGFGPKDRAAMFDHTTIDRYDPKARTTNKALQDYQGRVEGDDELCDLHDKAKHAKTPEERKALQEQIAEKRARHAKETGLSERIADPENPAKSVSATKRRKTAIEKKAEQNYEHRAEAKNSATPPKLVTSQAGADLFKKLNGLTAIAVCQDQT